MGSKNYPNFLILGPPKTASTSLHFYLSQHPEIFVSHIKETRFFDLNYKSDLETYKKFFEGVTSEKAIGEATPTYSFLPFVAERIKNDFPEMKLIFCFRNPVERAFSGWVMRHSKGSEKLSFREALKNNINQRQTIKFEGLAGEDIWLKDNLSVNKRNKLLVRTYIEGSMYTEQLKCYKKLFPESQIKVVLLEQFKNEFDATLKSIFQFLNVDTAFNDLKNEIKNKHRKNRLKILFNLFGKEKVKKVKTYFPQSLQNKFNHLIRVEDKKPEISHDDSIFAYSIFKDDIAELEKILQTDLLSWKL